KVEDLALVSGVGAAKLEQVKFEICVSSKGSSAQHSPSSLRKDLASEHHLSTTKININTATPAQLMSIRGITEKIANSIVDYRKEHGPFKSIEDLVRMDCINSSFLDKIRHQIFAERSRPPSTNTNGGLNFMAKPHPSPTSLSLQSEELDFPPGGPTQIISTRPSVEMFGGVRDGRPVLRVATWNLQSCSIEKANNPGVREVVCMTLLENRNVRCNEDFEITLALSFPCVKSVPADLAFSIGKVLTTEKITAHFQVRLEDEGLLSLSPALSFALREQSCRKERGAVQQIGDLLTGGKVGLSVGMQVISSSWPQCPPHSWGSEETNCCFSPREKNSVVPLYFCVGPSVTVLQRRRRLAAKGLLQACL
ncbi:PREDICTED: endonuclease/exonuclease/phosphatase family domain-containing protein 1, partial [Acanthisitta chloris]|uniref:endonuclease/exonuclease/phosphatase family domain-containing protein 1 n=1 Tax=Acanthisitta chloris TaxID=57068 RepID=UPI0004F0FEEF